MKSLILICFLSACATNNPGVCEESVHELGLENRWEVCRNGGRVSLIVTQDRTYAKCTCSSTDGGVHGVR